MGAFATVFQAEVFAIMASICESIARVYNDRTIMLFTDSQVALKALESVTVKSKLVIECLECLSELATHNTVLLGHEFRDMSASWAMRGLNNWLRRVQILYLLDPSPYLAYRTAWSSEQSGTGWRGNT